MNCPAIDGRFVLSSSADKTARLWDLEAGKELHCFEFDNEISGGSLATDAAVAVVVERPATIHYLDFSKARQVREFEERWPKARAALAKDPDDPSSLELLGRWYAFREIWDLATECLARLPADRVPNLILARCYWNLGEPDRAGAAMQKVLERGEAPAAYLRLCIEAIQARRKGGDIPITERFLLDDPAKHAARMAQLFPKRP